MVDLELARKLERAEAMANAAYVDARRAVNPESGADWMEVAGAYAMYDGAASPLTQTFGVGVFEPFGTAEFEQMERFFEERRAPTSHEVCSFAAPDTWGLLSSRGYTPIETSTVLVRPITQALPEAVSRITARAIEQGESQLWTRIAADGWGSESEELGAFIEDFGAVMARARGVHCFVAELDGKAIAAGALNISNGIALLAGATTIPSARRQGAQSVLFQKRLDFAASLGIEHAMVVTQPGSASQRNAVRQGFRPVYVRSKWQR